MTGFFQCIGGDGGGGIRSRFVHVPKAGREDITFGDMFIWICKN